MRRIKSKNRISKVRKHYNKKVKERTIRCKRFQKVRREVKEWGDNFDEVISL